MATMPQLIQQRLEQDAEVKRLNKEAKDAKATLEEIDAAIIASLDATGLEMGANDTHTAAIQEAYVPTNTDWETFGPFLIANDSLHLLERRIAVNAWREFYTIYGEYPPGTEAFLKRSLSFSKRQTRKK